MVIISLYVAESIFVVASVIITATAYHHHHFYYLFLHSMFAQAYATANGYGLDSFGFLCLFHCLLICCIDYTRHSVEEVIIKMEVSVWAS
jgi:hypothetical protein